MSVTSKKEENRSHDSEYSDRKKRVAVTISKASCFFSVGSMVKYKVLCLQKVPGSLTDNSCLERV